MHTYIYSRSWLPYRATLKDVPHRLDRLEGIYLFAYLFRVRDV